MLDTYSDAFTRCSNFCTVPSSRPEAGVFSTQVKDILQHLSYDSLGGQDGRPHLAFLSHHKADAGDAARIFVDTALFPRLFLDLSWNLPVGAHLRRHGAPAAREPALPRVGRAGADRGVNPGFGRCDWIC